MTIHLILAIVVLTVLIISTEDGRLDPASFFFGLLVAAGIALYLS